MASSVKIPRILSMSTYYLIIILVDVFQVAVDLAKYILLTTLGGMGKGKLIILTCINIFVHSFLLIWFVAMNI